MTARTSAMNGWAETWAGHSGAGVLGVSRGPSLWAGQLLNSRAGLQRNPAHRLRNDRFRNNDQLVRYRLLFPTSFQSGRRFDEIPFAAIERPAHHEYPAQNWIDWSDGNHGVALLNVGLPGSNVSDGTLMLSLMRSARVDAYANIGGDPDNLGPGIGSGAAAHVSLRTGAPQGSWQECPLFQAGLEFNYPLWCAPSTSIRETREDMEHASSFIA